MTDQKVFWSVPMERSIQEHAAGSLLNIAMAAGEKGYKRLALPYMRIDVARNKLLWAFKEHSTSPDDVLIMLDNDHIHPQNILERLASHPHDIGVVGGLAYRRGEPYDPLAFMRTVDGNLHSLASWETGATLIECTVLATCALAIKRWVVDKLDEAGYNGRYFVYRYPDEDVQKFPTEDMWFGEICEKIGVPHWLDVTVVSPHLTVSAIDGTSWAQWQADHHDAVREVKATGERIEAAPVAPAPANDPIAEILNTTEGWLFPKEAELLASLAARVNTPNVIVEIGAYRGRSSLVLASRALPGVEIYSVDPHVSSAGDLTPFSSEDRAVWTRNILNAGVAHRIAPINLPSQDVAKIWSKPIGLLFVDGAHGYEDVRDDLALWIPHVKAGNGLIAIHDTEGGWKGITQAISERDDLEMVINLTDTTTVYRVKTPVAVPVENPEPEKAAV